MAADLEGRMTVQADQIFKVFATFPTIARSTRWRAILNQAPINTIDLIRRAAQLRILRSLIQDQPSPFLVIKGPALAELAYPSPLQRHSIDLDILIAPDQVYAWLDHLKHAGFDTDVEELRPHAMNQIALRSPLGIVELHWALALPAVPTPPFEVLLEYAQTVTVGDLDILTLGPLHGAVHLCLHFHQHLGDPSVLMDLALWVARFDLYPEAIMDVAHAWGLGQIAPLALYLLGRLNCVGPISVPPTLAAVGDLLLEEYQAGRSLEGDDVEHFIYQLLSMMLLPNWWRPMALRLFLGPHRVGNVLGKWMSFSPKLQ